MKRSKFSLSHYKLFSGNMGALIPVGLVEVLPGDTFQHSTSALVRLSPLLAPVMHPVHVRIHHWFVPHRLIWEDWEDFITGGPDGMNASVFPTINSPASTGFLESSLGDYLGCPTGVPDQPVSALPFRAMALIWNEAYRDQDLQTELVIDKTSGPDTTTNTTLQNVCWEKDYFTSSRPWTQKGPAVTIPSSGEANVLGIGPFTNTGWVAGPTNVYETGTGLTTFANYKNANGTGNDNTLLIEEDGTTGNPDIRADLSDANTASINELRLAFALQRYEEARARYGSRYVEYLRYLGVRSSDGRLQRPEYLGGGKQTIQFSEVLQTGVTTDGDDEVGVGNLKGHGIAAVRSNKYRRFFEEHGYVITVFSVRPKTIYVQGLSRTWNRRTKEDFFQRELQHIGQQAVLNKEVYLAGASPDGTFGYQDRYDEYRRMESNVAGNFRGNLDFWHMARIFGAAPALNSSFVSSNPTDRIFAAQSEDPLWVMARHSIQARRIVDKMANPVCY